MSITAITVENFKGIKDPVRVEFKPITLLFGPNSAGKSTIIQALHYAYEIFERQNPNPDKTILGGEAIDLGGFESMVYKHDTTMPIRIRIDFDLKGEDLPNYIEGYEEIGLRYFEESSLYYIPDDVQTAWVEIKVSWSSMLGEPLVSSYQVGLNGEEFATIEATEDGRQINITKLVLDNSIFLGKSVLEKAKEELRALTPEDLCNLLKNSAKMILEEDLVSDDITRESLLGLGLCFFSLTSALRTDSGYLGITENIPLAGQASAMPHWGRHLDLVIPTGKREDDPKLQDELTQLMSSLIVGPGELIRNGLRKLRYVGPLREVPKRNHKPATSPDESRWSNGLAAYDILFYAEDAFINKVNEWLTQEERLATGYSVEVKKYRELETDNPLMLAILQDRILDDDVNLSKGLLGLPVKRRLLIRDEARDLELEPQDIGVGISQVLPVVVAALHFNTGLVTIEQPELHIHPAFQVALGDLFIEQVREKTDLCFILETHSEHIMLRLLRRIRETGEQEVPENKNLAPSDLSINFIEQTETSISCKTIRVDQDGDFVDHWPRGFFAERAKELFQ